MSSQPKMCDCGQYRKDQQCDPGHCRHLVRVESLTHMSGAPKKVATTANQLASETKAVKRPLSALGKSALFFEKRDAEEKERRAKLGYDTGNTRNRGMCR